MSDETVSQQVTSTIPRMSIARFLAASRAILASKNPKKKSIFVKGVHGIGKSSVIRQLAEEQAAERGLEFICFDEIDPASIVALAEESDAEEAVEPTVAPGKVWLDPQKHYVFYDIRLSQRDYVDFIGSITKVGNDAITRFVPVDWVVAFSHPDMSGMLFFDECDQAPQMVRNAAFEIVHDRRINLSRLSQGVSIFGAGNSGIGLSIYQAKPLGAALNDRFWICQLVPTVEEWCEWAESMKTSGHRILATYHRTTSSQGTLDYPEGRGMQQDSVQPSRRSWGDFGWDLTTAIENAGGAADAEEINNAILASLDNADLQEKFGGGCALPTGVNREGIKDILYGYVGVETGDLFEQWIGAQVTMTMDDVLGGKYDPFNLPEPTVLFQVFQEALRRCHELVEGPFQTDDGKSYYKPNEKAERVSAFLEEVFETHQEIGSVITHSVMTHCMRNIDNGDIIKAIASRGGAAFGNPHNEDGPFQHLVLAGQSTLKEDGDEDFDNSYEPRYSDAARQMRADKREHYVMRAESLEEAGLGDSEENSTVIEQESEQASEQASEQPTS